MNLSNHHALKLTPILFVAIFFASSLAVTFVFSPPAHAQATIGTDISGVNDVFAQGAERKLIDDQGLFWAFYTSNSELVYQTCTIANLDCDTNAAHWSSQTIITATACGDCNGISWLNDGSHKFAYVVITSTSTVFKEREGSLNSGGTITWSYAEATITLAHTLPNTLHGINVQFFGDNDQWVLTGTRATVSSGEYYMEMFHCTTTCGTSTNWSEKVIDTNQSTNAYQMSLQKDTSGYWAVFGELSQNLGLATIYTTNGGTNWSSTAASTCTTVFRGMSVVHVGNNNYIVDAINGGGGGCTANHLGIWSGTFSGALSTTDISSTFTTITTGGQAISTDGTQCQVFAMTQGGYNGGAGLETFNSPNCSPSNYQEQMFLPTPGTPNQGVTSSYDIINGYVMFAYGSGSSSPFNANFLIFHETPTKIIQSKQCTPAAGTSLTCAFSANTKAGSTILVGVMSSGTTAVSTVQDTQSLFPGSALITENAGTGGDTEVWCGAGTTASADTVTVTFGSSSTVAINIYEMTATSACSGFATSSGTGTGTSATVGSYTPTAFSFTLDFMASATSSAGSAGTNNFADFKTVVNSHGTVSQYRQNFGISDVGPITVGASVAWNEVAVSLYSSGGASTVTQPITITTLPSGSPTGTITISGCGVSNSTFGGDGAHTYSSLTPSCTITLATSGVSGNHRYEWDDSPHPTASTTLTFNTCPTVGTTCSTYVNMTYYQDSEQFAYSIVTFSTGATAPTLNYTGLGEATQYHETTTLTTVWLNHLTSWATTNPLVGSDSIHRWYANSLTSGTASAGSSVTTVYYNQLSNTYRFTPLTPVAWDAVATLTITGTQFGAGSTTGATLSTVNGGGSVQAAVWFDNNTQVTLTNPITISSTERWYETCGAGGNQFTQTTGGHLDDCNYGDQFVLTVTGGNGITFSVGPEGPGNWWNQGDSVTVSSNGVYSRSAGTGTRVSAWNIDGGSNTNAATTGLVTTTSMSMTATHTVNFISATQFQLTFPVVTGGTAVANTSPTIAGDTGWYDSGTTNVQFQATAISGYTFTSWTGSGAGSYTGVTNPQTVTMSAAISETASFLYSGGGGGYVGGGGARTTTSSTTSSTTTAATPFSLPLEDEVVIVGVVVLVLLYLFVGKDKDRRTKSKEGTQSLYGWSSLWRRVLRR